MPARTPLIPLTPTPGSSHVPLTAGLAELKEPCNRVFVYGTLKRAAKSSFFEERTFAGEVHAAGALPLMAVSRCCATLAMAQSKSRAKYDVDDETLSRLDDLESVDSGTYQRTKTESCCPAKMFLGFYYIGRSEYWDNKKRAPFTDTDQHGRLNWVAPDMRAK